MPLFYQFWQPDVDSPTYRTERRDVPSISILEDESTVPAFPFLIFEQPCQLAFNQGVLFASLLVLLNGYVYSYIFF